MKLKILREATVKAIGKTEGDVKKELQKVIADVDKSMADGGTG